ncbi:MAG: hypothetical protein CMB79_11985 [Filomicrobium sp.]|nr:hypothetical protein [Filomicrobium sp.]
MAWLKFLIGLEQPPASLSIIISALVTRWDMANPSLANRSAILPCLARPASEVSPKGGGAAAEFVPSPIVLREQWIAADHSPARIDGF